MVNNINKDDTIHDLKIWPEFFTAVVDGKKPTEIRLNDRDYHQGDLINFREWDPKTEDYTGRHVYKEIYYTLAFSDLSAQIKNVLGINPSPASLNKLIILTIGPLTMQGSAKVTINEMRNRTLNIEGMGKIDFTAKHILGAHIYKISEATDKCSSLLGSYVINSNTFHPIWNQWICTLIHLRNVEGISPAHKQYPQAEFELMIRAIDPESPITDRTVSHENIKTLMPPESVVQFNGITDDQALGVQSAMMGLIANSQISPDSDFRTTWTQEINRRVQDIRSAH